MENREKVGYSENAYFSVEATLVFTVVLGIVFLLIGMMFFQYNRCLLEQDLSAVLLRTCSMRTDNERLSEDVLRDEINQIDWTKYIAWSENDITSEIQGNRIRIMGKGKTEFLLLLLPGEKAGETEATYEVSCIDPVDCLRLYKKVYGGE